MKFLVVFRPHERRNDLGTVSTRDSEIFSTQKMQVARDRTERPHELTAV